MRYRPCLFGLLVFIQSITGTARAQSHDTLARLSGAAVDSSEYLQPFSALVFRDTLVLHFDFDRYTLRRKDAARLDSLLNGPSFTPGKPWSVYICGYTDTAGTASYNQKLAARRANTTLEYIYKHSSSRGVIPTTYITQGGEKKPIPGSDSLNRRVEIVFGYGATASQVVTVPEPPAVTVEEARANMRVEIRVFHKAH